MESKNYPFPIRFKGAYADLEALEKETRKAFSEEEIALAKEEGYKEGYEAGKNDELVKQEEQANKVIALIEDKITQLFSEKDQHESLLLAQTIDLAQVILKKVHPALDEKVALLEVEATLKKCLDDFRTKEKLIIYLNKDTLPKIKKRIQSNLEEEKFKTKINFIGKEGLEGGDIIIDWEEGGYEYLKQPLLESIDQILKNWTPEIILSSDKPLQDFYLKGEREKVESDDTSSSPENDDAPSPSLSRDIEAAEEIEKERAINTQEANNAEKSQQEASSASTEDTEKDTEKEKNEKISTKPAT